MNEQKLLFSTLIDIFIHFEVFKSQIILKEYKIVKNPIFESLCHYEREQEEIFRVDCQVRQCFNKVCPDIVGVNSFRILKP